MALHPTSHYRPLQRQLHWVIFAVVLLAYLLVFTHVFTARENPVHGPVVQWHMLAGILVLLLTLARVWVRRKYGKPPIQPPLTRIVGAVAGLTHGALYAFLIVQPLLGFALVQVAGRAVKVSGFTLIPALVSEPNKALAGTIHTVHTVIGLAFLAVIALHVAAALWHHYRVHDDTLRRMLGPGRS